MKRGITVAGILFVLLIAGSGCHRFNRRPMRNYSGMNMYQNFRHQRWMHGMGGNMFQGRRFGMNGGGMDQGMRSPMMGNGKHHGMMGYGMMGNMRRMGNDSTAVMPFGAGRRMLESIPNVTSDQKKQIEDLLRKQQDDMKKLREEMSAKMKDEINSNRKDMLNILTAEQKKFIENKTGKPENVK